MNEENLIKILKLQEEGMSWQEIAKRFPQTQKELQEIKSLVEMLDRTKTTISPDADLLHAILRTIPAEQKASRFSQFATLVLKVGTPLAVAAAAFVLVFTLTSSPVAPPENFDQLALKEADDSAAGTRGAAPSLMAAPEQNPQAAPNAGEGAPSSNASAADQAADQALASPFNDGSASDAAMQSYFDQSSFNAYDQSANSTF